ncbi:MAG: trypsin-like peptidase domain-containing protein [Oscillospiraceae bacterium]|nr:trypsin-like peptidase domain-containing protein [Oscillospiraceae bacterium]
MMNQNNNNNNREHKGLSIMKVSAALAAMLLVSGTSIGMYKMVENIGASSVEYSVSENIAEAGSNAAKSQSSTAVQATNMSWLELASAADALSIPEIVEKAMPSAVGIKSTFTYAAQTPAAGYRSFGYGEMFGNAQTAEQEATATGSGIVMSSDGYIVTNAHVIYDTESEYKMGKATAVSVVMGENHDEEYEAEIVGYDIQTDLAVLKIDAEGLTPAEFGNSDDLKVGELVVAIGNPLGFELYGTTTCGIVSAKNREVELEDKTMTLIQTDAAINSGNSGGMLLNSYGQVIGINSLKMGSSYGEASVEGLGFAIPINDAAEIIKSLINDGYVTGRPQLGITGTTITEEQAAFYHIPQGVYVYSAPENGESDLQQGDVITAIDGAEILTMEELNERKNLHKSGETVTLRISRNGESMDVQVTLQESRQQE